MNRIYPTLLALLFAAISSTHASDESVVSLIVENDVIAGSDRHYTAGALLSWVSSLGTGPGRVDKLGRRLPTISKQNDLHIGFALGHELYTPKEIEEPALIVDDRPYAAYAYFATDITDRRSDDSMTTYRLSLGMVGPSAHGKQIQRSFHRRIGSPIPQGWDHQLQDQFVWNLYWDKQWQSKWLRTTHADLLPHISLAAGNVNSYAGFGATLRVGYNLGVDYGPPRIRPSLPGATMFGPTAGGTTSFYFFLSAHGSYVIHNIFLDGNTRGTSHSVEKRKEVGELQAGFVLSGGRYRLAYSFVARTRQFTLQEKHNKFGSLTLSARF